MSESRQPIQIQFQSAVFTADELCRLVAYRAAVAAGFYTDNCAAESTDRPATLIAVAHDTARARDAGR